MRHMRKNFKANTYLYPQPVFIIGSYDENGIPDAMNAAWGGICDYQKVFLCLSAEHKTVKNILKRKALTISMANTENVVACDYVGIVSANDVKDKLKNTGWTIIKSEFVDAPLIQELPLTLECEMESFDEKTDIMIAKIINVSADESILTEGKIDVDKLKPITYDAVSHHYIQLGKKVGHAFQDGLKIKQQKDCEK